MSLVLLRLIGSLNAVEALVRLETLVAVNGDTLPSVSKDARRDVVTGKLY